jgi:hypothetical protein
VSGLKGVENRTWPTSYRGALHIHAAKGVDPIDGWMEEHRWIAETMAGAQIWTQGAVVGEVALVGCHRPLGKTCCEPWGQPGMWHWELVNATHLTAPAPTKGALGLWRLDPVTVAAIDREQGKADHATD